jgi:RNA polymerase sigma-70 factor (ECF subfamily)
MPRAAPAVSVVELDTQALVARIRAGDVAAFERVYRAQHAPLCAFVARYVSAPDRAAELVQTIFAQLWQQRARLQVATTIERYLFGAARNAAVHAVRHELVERRWRERMATELGDDEQRRSTANTADASLDAQDVAAAVRRALTALPPRCVTAFMLRWQRQLSYVEIAEVMGVSAKTVDVYLTRANMALREAKESLRALR